jgi:hypothetical protein
MGWMTFWESVAALRRAEFITLIVTLVLPLLSGTILLTLRHRIKTLLDQTTQIQGAFYHDSVERLVEKNDALSHRLGTAGTELTTLRQVTAPREITSVQEDILLEKLRGASAAPVIVAAYAFEDESASYAAEIAAVLRKAGWNVSVNKSSMNDFKGISLGKIALMHQPLSGLHELAQAFTEARLDLRQRDIHPDTIAGQLEDGRLLVVVGRK